MKKNEEAPIATAALGVSGFMIAAFPIVWLELPYLFFGWMPKTENVTFAIIPILIYVGIYISYKHRYIDIIKKYENSNYNEQIPYIVFPLSTFVIFFVAMIFEIPLHIWLKDNHYDGIVLKWFLGLFE